MSGEVQIRFPAQFSHSVRIEQTAKGARITVRALANNQEEAINHNRCTVKQREDLKLRVIK